MKRAVSVFAILLTVAGLIFFLQGIGILLGSSMTNQPQWAIIGILLVVIGGWLLVSTNRAKNKEPQA